MNCLSNGEELKQSALKCFKETGQVLSVALINPAYQELARQLTGTHGEKHSGNWPRERAVTLKTQTGSTKPTDVRTTTCIQVLHL